jgi:hypothetical protein
VISRCRAVGFGDRVLLLGLNQYMYDLIIMPLPFRAQVPQYLGPQLKEGDPNPECDSFGTRPGVSSSRIFAGPTAELAHSRASKIRGRARPDF